MTSVDILLDRLGDVPLAVAQASAYISRRLLNYRSTQYTIFAKLDEELQNYGNMFLEQLKKQTAFSLPGYRSDSISAAWEITFQAIQKHDPAAAELLHIMAFLNRRYLNPGLLQHAILPSGPSARLVDYIPGPWTALAQGRIPTALIEDWLSIYSSFLVVEFQEALHAYSMHPLIHTLLRARLPRHLQEYYAIQAMRLIETGSRLEIIDPRLHAEEVLDALENYFTVATVDENSFHLDPTALLNQKFHDWIETCLQKLMLLWGLFDDIYLFFMHLKAPRDARHVTVPWRYAYVLGDRLDHQGLLQWSYQEACVRLHYRHPLAIKIAGSYANLFFQGEQSMAGTPSDWFQWLARIRTITYGPKHPSTAGAWIGLGRMLDNMERYKDAYVVLHRAYEVRKLALGFNDRLTLNALRWLSITVAHTQDRRLAVDYFRETYEEGVLCAAEPNWFTERIAGIVLYQLSGQISLPKSDADNIQTLCTALGQESWATAVPEPGKLYCDFSQPDWCQCLRVWDAFFNSRWTRAANLPRLDGEKMTPAAELNMSESLYGKCDIWYKLYIEDLLDLEWRINATVVMLNVSETLRAASYGIDSATEDMNFDEWVWIWDAGLRLIASLLECPKYVPHSSATYELAIRVASSLYSLSGQSRAGFAFLLAQATAFEHPEEACKWYDVAETDIQRVCPDSKKSNKTMHGMGKANDLPGFQACRLHSVVLWAQALCLWQSQNYLSGRNKALAAISAGDLRMREIELILVDLRDARRELEIKEEQVYVLALDVTVNKSKSPFISCSRDGMDYETWVRTTIADELLDTYGPAIAHEWTHTGPRALLGKRDDCAKFCPLLLPGPQFFTWAVSLSSTCEVGSMAALHGLELLTGLSPEITPHSLYLQRIPKMSTPRVLKLN